VDQRVDGNLAWTKAFSQVDSRLADTTKWILFVNAGLCPDAPLREPHLLIVG